MRKYNKPIIEEETIEIEDVIALSGIKGMSSPEDSFNPENPGDSMDI